MSTHTTRFSAALVTLLAGGLCAVAALVFPPAAGAWIVFGLACSVVLGALSAFATPGQGAVARTVDVLVVLLGGWAIVASRVFANGPALKWLDFADGAGLFGLGLVAVVAHEALLEARLKRILCLERSRSELAHRPGAAPAPRPSSLAGG